MNFFRKAKWVLLSVLGLATLFSCIKADDYPYGRLNSKVKISGIKDSPQTKTELNGLSTTWIADSDKIGIFSPQCRITSDGDPGVSNAIFTALTNGAISSFSGEIYWGTEASDFYSYYPHQTGEFSYTQVPVSIPAEQTQSAGDNSSHLGNLDFLVSKPVTGLRRGKTAEGASVSLNFNHLFTLLEFQIINSQSSVNISKIRLKGSNRLSFSSGNLDISQPEPAAGAPYTIGDITGEGNEVLLNITTPFATTDNYNTTPKAYMVIMPGVQMGELAIQIEINGSFKEIKRNAITFERGNKYIVKVDASLTSVPLINGYELEPVIINGLLWAPVNAGYSIQNPQGLYYQWHRKYGQEYNDGTKSITLINDLVDLNTGNNPLNSNIFYYQTSYPYDWCSVSQPSWSISENYNPCPSGWRLPTSEEFMALLSTGRYCVDSESKLGVDGLAGCWYNGTYNNTSESIFLPFAGWNKCLTGYGADINSIARYWTSSTSANTSVKYWYFSKSSSNFTDAGRAYGMSVRCVLDPFPILLIEDELTLIDDIVEIPCKVLSEGAASILEKGIVYSETPSPTTSDIKIISGVGAGDFFASITNISESKIYFVRAYAINKYATSYSNEITVMSEYYPGTDKFPVKCGNTLWAPVNAGYDKDTYPYGLYFQWNRLYGQDSTAQRITVSVTVEEANEYSNRDYFYSLWSATALPAEWSLLYNPCPEGWRVPTETEFKELNNSGKVTGTDVNGTKGLWFNNNTIFLPHLGYRGSSGSMTSVNTQGYYWTDKKMYYPTHTTAGVSTTYTVYGMSIRCVKKFN